MKANELMIGDWVKLMNPKGEWIDSSQLNANLFGIFLRDGEDGFLQFAPIPLTEEILKANGIKLSDEHCVFTDSKHFSFNREADYGRVYNMDGDNHHEVMMPFKYVHEIQHALRLCGLNDIADNFKLVTT